MEGGWLCSQGRGGAAYETGEVIDSVSSQCFQASLPSNSTWDPVPARPPQQPCVQWGSGGLSGDWHSRRGTFVHGGNTVGLRFCCAALAVGSADFGTRCIAVLGLCRLYRVGGTGQEGTSVISAPQRRPRQS